MRDIHPSRHRRSHAEEDLHLAFFLAHIDPRFSGDTNADVGEVLVALAYPSIIVIGPSPEFARNDVDVRQPDCLIEPDCFPLRCFLERFPEVCPRIIAADENLLGRFLRWQTQVLRARRPA